MLLRVLGIFTYRYLGPGSSVGIAIDYGLDGPGSNPRPSITGPPKKQAAIIWIMANIVAYRLQTQRRLSLTDYMDFLQRARCKEYHRALKTPTAGRYLNVL